MIKEIKLLICPGYVSFFEIGSTKHRPEKKIAILIPKDIKIKESPIELNFWNIDILERNYEKITIENIENSYNVFFYPKILKNYEECENEKTIRKINSYINTEILK